MDVKRSEFGGLRLNQFVHKGKRNCFGWLRRRVAQYPESRNWSGACTCGETEFKTFSGGIGAAIFAGDDSFSVRPEFLLKFALWIGQRGDAISGILRVCGIASGNQLKPNCRTCPRGAIGAFKFSGYDSGSHSELEKLLSI